MSELETHLPGITLAGDTSNLTKLADELRLVASGPQVGHPWLAAEGTSLIVWLW